jgi:hypothetical protein
VRLRSQTALPVLCVLLATSASATAATVTQPYRIAPTLGCLIHHRARLLPPRDTIPLHLIRWVLGYGAGFPVTIEVEFLPNPTLAAARERRLRHAYRVERLSRTWIERHLLRRENVVVHPDVSAAKVSARQIATIVNCLRR